MALTYPIPAIEVAYDKVEPACDCGCSCGGEPTDAGCDDGTPVVSYDSPVGVRYFNGQVRIDATDLKSGGYGQHWEHTRIYNNLLASPAVALPIMSAALAA